MFALLQEIGQNQKKSQGRRAVASRHCNRRPRLFIPNAAAGFTLIEIMIVVLIIGILLGIAAPNFVRTREQSRKKACIGNLRQIQYAKDAFLMDRNLATTVTPADTDLYGAGNYLKVTPLCPGGGTYTIGSGNQDPTCSYTSGSFTHVITGN